MRVVIVTSVVSPHLIPFCDALSGIIGLDNICYYAKLSNFDWRSSMGWSENQRDYIKSRDDFLDSFLSDCITSDIVIFCERDSGLIKKRLRCRKKTFYMSARWFKPPLGFLRFLSPKYFITMLNFRKLSFDDNFYYLAIGRYAAADMCRFANFKNRIFLWGYFVGTATDCILREFRTRDILYAGRLVPFKRVDILIRAFGILCVKYPDLKLRIIGDGPCLRSIVNLVSALGIESRFVRDGFVPMEHVWAQMKDAALFVLPSDYGEGWGAVVNEAMSCGCPVVCSSGAGASTALIKDGINGLIFKNGDVQALVNCIERLIVDDKLSDLLSINAAETMSGLWSANNAAVRFSVLISEVLEGGAIKTEWDNGPLSLIYESGY